MKKLPTILALMLVALTANAQSCPDNNHPHMIDLGLPSGTKWACCNVDTEHPEKQSPTNYGGYYAWGETTEKNYYHWRTYIHCDGGHSTIHDLGSDIAGTQYDVAHEKWGGIWVLPSQDQIEELLANCTYEWTKLKGKNGGKFTGKNGGSIFLPAAGCHWCDNFESVGSSGSYYSSMLYPSISSFAYYLHFDSGVADLESGFRSCGYTVRPVSK